MRSVLAVPSVLRRSGWVFAIVVIVVAGGAGCRTASSGETRRVDRSVITREQMIKGAYVTVFDAVAALHSNWLRPRGPDSFVLPTIVWVYIDGTRAGGVEVLHNIQPKLVNAVRFYDGPTATGRWGVDNGAGVIHVSTWSDGAGGIPLPDSTRDVPRAARDSASAH
jgi:hypothetical protein